MDNFLLQGLQHATGASLAFSNGWAMARRCYQGRSRRTTAQYHPANPPVSLVDLTGDEIWTLLEENLEQPYARDP